MGKKAAEVEFEVLKLLPRNTHGILGGVTGLAFPLKLVFLSLLIFCLSRDVSAQPGCPSVWAGTLEEVKSVPFSRLAQGPRI